MTTSKSALPTLRSSRLLSHSEPKMNALLLIQLATVCAMGLAASPSDAAPVTYVFSGSVDSDEAGRGFRNFTGSFTFDSAAVDLVADPKSGIYAHSGAPWGTTLAFDGGAAFTVNDSLYTGVSDDSASLGRDRWTVLAGAATQSISLVMTDLTALLFSNDAQPLSSTGLTLADFGTSELRWVAGDTLTGHLDALSCSSGCDGNGELPSSNPVPQPSSLLLASLGLGLALRLRRAP